MPSRLVLLCALALSTAACSANVETQQRTPSPGPSISSPVAAEPRHLVTAMRSSALLVRDGDVLASDERGLLHRVLLDAQRTQTSFQSPTPYPGRLLAANDDAVLLANDETIDLVRLDGTRVALAGGQRVQTIARDATHLYWINGGAPRIRRILLPSGAPPSGSTAPLPPVEAVASIADPLSDLAVEGGEVFATSVSAQAVLRVRAGGQLETFANLPTPPSVLALSARALFVGAYDGSVYRVARTDGRVTLLGRIVGGVRALAQEGCFVFAASGTELLAFEIERGVEVPLVEGVDVHAVAAHGGRIYYADHNLGGIYELATPACPAATAAGKAFVVTSSASPPAAMAPPEDRHPLAHHSDATMHTVVVTFATSSDSLARATARPRVERVLSENSLEMWARATDAQVMALVRDGFWTNYRDGVDLLRGVNVRDDPAAALRPPPAPFHDSATPRYYLVQLALPTHAIPDLANELDQRGAKLLETPGPATIVVEANRPAAERLAKMDFVTWLGAYGVRERLSHLLPSDPNDDAGLDAHLKALADWIEQEPKAEVELTAALFTKSAEFKQLVKQLGGRFPLGTANANSDQPVIVIRRAALAAIAAHPALRVLEQYAEPTLE
ncbi:MAG: hypothetical protein HOW73_05855 [Polyangiaceae bacterium]|nr:hypothetical protein [Polyangiaceae bacterium]